MRSSGIRHICRLLYTHMYITRLLQRIPRISRDRGNIQRTHPDASHGQGKRDEEKYLRLSSRHRFVQLPIAIETTGGVGPRTETLVKAMADASAEQLLTWSRDDVIRELLGSIAMAVQRGNAMTFLEGYDRALQMALAQHAASARQRVAAEQKEDDRDIATTEDESEGEEESSSEEQRDQEDAA